MERSQKYQNWISTNTVEKPRVAISGAAGYVGSALARLLIQKNYEVYLFDNYMIPSNIKEVEGVKIWKKDVNDEELGLEKYDVLFHLAAISGIGACEKNKGWATANNINGTMNVLRKFDGKIIFASTSAVYGQCQSPVIDETHPTHPRSHYGMTKLVGEYIVQCHPQYVILRFSNIYGMGLFSKRTVTDLFIDKALKGESLQIHGDGRQRRDFVHINDVICAYFLAMESSVNGIYNIGGDEALNVNDIARLVKKNHLDITGEAIKCEHVDSDAGIQWKDFDYACDRAKTGILYEPSHTINHEIRTRIIQERRRLESVRG